MPTATEVDLHLARLASLASLGETRERILWLWSAPGSSWLCAEVIADEVGISVSAAGDLLALLVQAGLLQRIELNFGFFDSARWNVSELGASLIRHLQTSYVAPAKAVEEGAR